MKRFFFILCLIFTNLYFANCCEICGCGVGNTYIGVLPEFGKQIIGVRYRYNSIITHLGVGNVTTYLTSKEFYNTTELWGGFKIAHKWRLLSSIPYNFNHRINGAISNSKSGIGDINNIFYYELLNNKTITSNNQLLVNAIWLGAGIKLPTGKYNSIDKNTVNSNNLFQLGTGSTDFLIAAMYDLRFQNIGININSNYKINTTNYHHYKYGNKLSINGQLYYKFKIGNSISMVPNAGILYETSKKDTDNGEIVDISGGNITMSGIGMETSYKKLALGFNWQSPLNQNLAMTIIKGRDRLMVHLSFSF